MIIKNLRIEGSKKFNFLIIPHPLDDELFSSWLARTSYSHHLHPQTFFNVHFGLNNRNFLRRDIDCNYNKEIFDIFKYKSYNKIDINAMTLKSYSGYLQEKEIKNGMNRLFCNLRYCPMCLNEDKVPYFRKAWKLAFNTACLKHNCFLYENCPQCKTPLKLTKMYKNKYSFTQCFKCGCDLKSAKALTIDPLFYKGLIAIKKLNKLLQSGYITFLNNTIYSFIFFDTIIQLTKLICLRQYTQFINSNQLFSLLKAKLSKPLNSAQPIYQQLTIPENYALFGLIINLFENYPNNLSKFIEQNKLTYADMLKDIKYISFWYDNIINSITPRFVPFGDIITEQEIKEGIKHLKSKNKEITKANLSRLFGNINHFANMKNFKDLLLTKF